MPVDVMIVAGDPGEGRVPWGSGGCFDVVRRLKADMAYGEDETVADESRRERDGALGANTRLAPSPFPSSTMALRQHR